MRRAARHADRVWNRESSPVSGSAAMGKPSRWPSAMSSESVRPNPGLAPANQLDHDRIAVHEERFVGGERAAPCLPGGVAPMLAQRVKMRGRGAELRIGQGNFAAPGFICESESAHGASGRDGFHPVPDFSATEWDAVERVPPDFEMDKIRINDHPPAAVAERGPAVCLTENILRRQLARAHFLVAPETCRIADGCARRAAGSPAQPFSPLRCHKPP